MQQDFGVWRVPSLENKDAQACHKCAIKYTVTANEGGMPAQGIAPDQPSHTALGPRG